MKFIIYDQELLIYLNTIGKINISIDDCIEDIHEPLYGFRTKVTLLKDSPCNIGSTCDSLSLSGTYICLQRRNSVIALHHYSKEFRF